MITDLYSKRRKRELGQNADVYQYDPIPVPLKVQIYHIFNSVFDPENNQYTWELFGKINVVLCREYGVVYLGDTPPDPWENPYKTVITTVLNRANTDQVLDLVELALNSAIADSLAGGWYAFTSKIKAGIAELNIRFREHGMGYQFESGKIIRIDNQVVHAAAVQPALRLLAAPEFAGANQEYLSAHEHYRHGSTKECLTDCLKAFESTMKVICAKRGWAFKPTDTAKPLLDVIFQNNLIPAFMQSHFTGVRATLEAGVPTVRNKLGGHGQGATPVEVPDSLAAYALHLTAANILLLVQAEKEMP